MQRQWFLNVQTNITIICILYLLFDQFESEICQNDEKFEQQLQLNKLYNYTAHNWDYHAQKTSTSYHYVMNFFQK